MSEPLNILWFMTEEHRTDSLGGYGYSWARTPTVDRLTDKRVALTNANDPGVSGMIARLMSLAVEHVDPGGLTP
jgi:hypothetical protein